MQSHLLSDLVKGDHFNSLSGYATTARRQAKWKWILLNTQILVKPVTVTAIHVTSGCLKIYQQHSEKLNYVHDYIFVAGW